MPDRSLPTDQPSPTATRRARAALGYAELGWPVLPLHTPAPGGDCSCGNDCRKPGKHPRSRHGLQDATTNAEQVAAWWAAWPDANIGVATGQLLVIDVDGGDGSATLAELEAAHAPLPATLTATTGRGLHLYFAANDQRIGNSAARLGAGLDIRGRGGYVVVPPSQHADGRRYRWNTRHAPAPLPAWLAELLAPAQRTPAPARPPTRLAATDRRTRYFEAALHAELGDVASAQPGTRNHTLNRAAFRLAQLVASGHGDINELPEQLLQVAVTAGLTEAEARSTINSGLEARAPAPAPHTAARAVVARRRTQRSRPDSSLLADERPSSASVGAIPGRRCEAGSQKGDESVGTAFSVPVRLLSEAPLNLGSVPRRTGRGERTRKCGADGEIFHECST